MNDQTIAKIEDRIDQKRAGEISISFGSGGLQIRDMRDVMEMAKLLAVSAQAVPKHLRGEPGMCLGICIQAIEWRLSPYAVANKSYVVNDRLAYESQLIHSVVEARAPLVGRLRCTYAGDNGDRTCTVIGTFKGENEPHEYTTPKVKDIKIKNSPLWQTDVDQQLWFYGSRAWARKWCPDTLLGIYTPEEAEQFPAGDHAKDVTPKLLDRLSGRMTEGKGFHPDNVANGIKDTAGDDAAAARSPGHGADHGGTAAGSKPSPDGPAAEIDHDADGVVLPGKGAAHAPDVQEATNPPQDTQGAQAAPAGGKRTSSRKAKEPVPAKDDAPAQAKADPDVFPEPWVRRTGAEYVAYAISWMARATSDPAIDRRWSDERKIRNALGTGVTEEEMDDLHRHKTEAKNRCKAGA